METMKAIAKRKSTRQYKADQIPVDTLDKILTAGCAAPVGMKRYDSLHLTVVQDQEVMKQISEGVKKLTKSDSDPLYGAPTLVLISSMDLPVPGLGYANVSFVTENMALAATDLEIGSVVIWGAAMAAAQDGQLLSKLAIPEGFKPLASIALGYPAVPDPSEKEMKLTISLNRV